MLTKDREARVLELCQSLIRVQSYSGQEGGVVQVLRKFFEENGYDDVLVDRYGNIIGSIKGSLPGPCILFDGHVDTVPVTDPSAWKHGPFSATIEGGKLYGRGASDMKGAVAAMACGVAFFAEDCGRNFAGTLSVAGVVHEECFEGVAAREISAQIKPDFVVIGEASNLNVKIGQRGRAEIKLETFGKPAHSANPEKGINAVYQMCKAVEAVRGLVPPEHPVLGKGILELTDMKSSPYPGASVVPEYCCATYDRRLLTGETPEHVLAPLQELVESLSRDDPQFSAKVSYAMGEERCYTGEMIRGNRFFPGWLFEETEPFVLAVVNELRHMGYAPEVAKYNFCTNGSHYAGEAGIRTIGLGPSEESLAHTVDEYIALSQLYGAADCYSGVISALLATP